MLGARRAARGLGRYGGRRLSTVGPMSKPPSSRMAEAPKTEIPTRATPPRGLEPASPPTPSSSLVGPMLLLAALTAPAGAAVYLRMNPDWKPSWIGDSSGWSKFRGVVIGEHDEQEKIVTRKEPRAVVVERAKNAPNAEVVTRKPKAMKEKEVISIQRAAPDAGTASETHVAPVAADERDDHVEVRDESRVLETQMGRQMHTTAKEIVDALRAEASAAANEVDNDYLRGLEDLDANALAIRVAQMAAEMKHRSKWEATRLMESLRKMEEDAKIKTTEILERQQAAHKEELERELRLQKEDLERQARNEQELLKRRYDENLARILQEKESTLQRELEERFNEEKKMIEDRFTKTLLAKSEELDQVLTSERTQRVAELADYRAQLKALNDVLERTSMYEALSHQVHKASMAALALSDRIEAAAPLGAEIKALREAARNDEFIEAAVASLPTSAVEDGAPSVAQLQERFKAVKKAARHAALIPEDSSLMGRMFAGALSYLIIPPGGPIEGSDTEAIISRADYALRAGYIDTAVMEMKSLSGLPAEMSRDWIAAAESRLSVEQTAKVVKAHVALLAASCS